jgi:hypothetical protein
MTCFAHRLSPLAMALLGLSFVAGCSGADDPHPVPSMSDAAWAVDLQNNGAPCSLIDSIRSLGEVGSEVIVERVNDGQAVAGLGVASVACSVVETATAGVFSVNARASAGPDALEIVIPSITAAAREDQPVFGSVAYASDATMAVFQSTACNVFFSVFEDGPGEQQRQGVGPGKVWVTFECAAVIDPATHSTCAIAESFAVFEDCATTGR